MPTRQHFNNGAELPQTAQLAPGDRQAVEKVLDGLIAVLDQERAALGDMARTQFGDFTRQKLQLLVQLNRAVQSPTLLPASIEEKLRRARRMLDDNAAVLKRRMDAIREVAALISKEIRDAESDGTYSVSGGVAGAYRQV
ncbi:MAG: hypothetical protein LJE67_13710 [Salaquimonas sp.]|jgi:flagellar biosynthesis/type III secretory pathway chaperone|nr:hypothetical protein [Salaquimonas sp.]